jgi:hypothetical protein
MEGFAGWKDSRGWKDSLGGRKHRRKASRDRPARRGRARPGPCTSGPRAIGNGFIGPAFVGLGFLKAGPMIEPRPSLIQALARALKPLVRLAIGAGLTYPRLADLLKRLYVEAAEETFRLDDKAQTASRISLLTGVHRKDVKRLREEAVAPAAPGAPAPLSLAAEVIGAWLAEPGTSDEDGRPLPLPRSAPEGTLSFESLARSVSQDIRPRAMLDELVRLGAVRIEAAEHVRLDTAALVPSEDYDGKAYYFGRNLRDHIEAGAHNLERRGPPFFDRAVFYSGLTREDAERLRQLSATLGAKMILKVNEEALKLERQARGRAAARWRITFGGYFFAAEAEPASAPAADMPQKETGS